MKRKKCIILLPSKYNDNSEVPTGVLNGILADIDEKFDGHAVDGYCNGTYRMATGDLVSDTCLKIWVVVDPGRVEELKAIVSQVAKTLKQESIYFELTSAEVEFIKPVPEIGDQL